MTNVGNASLHCFTHPPLGSLLNIILALCLLASGCGQTTATPPPAPTATPLPEPQPDSAVDFVPGQIQIFFDLDQFQRAEDELASFLDEMSLEVIEEYRLPDGFPSPSSGQANRVRIVLSQILDGTSLLDKVEQLQQIAGVVAAPNLLHELDATWPNEGGAGPDGVMGTPDDTGEFQNQWGLHNVGQAIGGVACMPDVDIDAPEMWDLVTSTTAVVAVVGSGVQRSHPDLEPNLWVNRGETPANGLDDDGNGYIDDVNGWDFVGDDIAFLDPALEDGHETQVAGVIGAQGNNGVATSGVAWDVPLMALRVGGRVSGDRSVLAEADVAQAFLYAYSNGARVINYSAGSAHFSGVLFLILHGLQRWKPNVTVVTSAGNNGYDLNTNLPGDPSRYPCAFRLDSIICVGAHSCIGARWANSGFGTIQQATPEVLPPIAEARWGLDGVDLLAPGVHIRTTYPGAPASLLSWESGTSLAAPHVAGVAALLAGLGLSGPEIRTAIQNGVVADPRLGFVTIWGGRLNGHQAVRSAFAEPLPPRLFWDGMPEDLRQVLQPYLSAFVEQHPDLSIRQLPRGEKVWDKYQAALVAGQAPALVVGPPDSALLTLAGEGFLAPLDGFAGDVYPAALQLFSLQGRPYALPLHVTSVALIYNTNLVSRPPASLDEMVAMARPEHPLVFFNQPYFVSGLLHAFGGRVLGADLQCGLEEPGSVAFFEWLAALADSESVIVCPDYTCADQSFRDGQAAMIINGPWAIPAYREALGDAIGVLPLPRAARETRPWLGSDAVVALNPQAADDETIGALLQLLLSAEVQLALWPEAGLVPVNRQVSLADPWLRAFMGQAASAEPFPYGHIDAIWDAIQGALQDVAFGGVSPPQAVESACSDIGTTLP